jgi:hypothetical protein
MDNEDTYTTLKDIIDGINKYGTFYDGTPYYGEDDYENFIIEDKDGDEYYKGEKQ